MTILQEIKQKETIKNRIEVLECFIKNDFSVPWLKGLCSISGLTLLLSALLFVVTSFLPETRLTDIVYNLSVHGGFISWVVCVNALFANFTIEKDRRDKIVGQISLEQAKAELEHLNQKLKNMENVKARSVDRHITINNNKSGDTKNKFAKSKQKNCWRYDKIC